MSGDPTDPGSHAPAIAEVERQLGALLPVDEQGQLVNELVGWLRDHPDVDRVADLAEAFGIGERTLQRLVLHRVGMTPKWLIQRRRLHDAVERLKAGTTSLAEIAADLGYTDQAHFTQDFRTVTGMTPGHYLARPAAVTQAVPPGLDAQRRLGTEWADWLDRLPRLRDELVAEWRLTLDGAPTHGFCSLVLPRPGRQGRAGGAQDRPPRRRVRARGARAAALARRRHGPVAAGRPATPGDAAGTVARPGPLGPLGRRGL